MLFISAFVTALGSVLLSMVITNFVIPSPSNLIGHSGEVVFSNALQVLFFFLAWPTVSKSLQQRRIVLAVPKIVIEWFRWRTPAYDRTRWQNPSGLEIIARALIFSTIVAVSEAVVGITLFLTITHRVAPLSMDSPFDFVTNFASNIKIAAWYLSTHEQFAFDVVVVSSAVLAAIAVGGLASFWTGLRCGSAYSYGLWIFAIVWGTTLLFYSASEAGIYWHSIGDHTRRQTYALVAYSFPVSNSRIRNSNGDYIVGSVPKLGGQCLKYAIQKEPTFAIARAYPEFDPGTNTLSTTDFTKVSPNIFPSAIYSKNEQCRQAVDAWLSVLRHEYAALRADDLKRTWSYFVAMLSLHIACLPLGLLIWPICYFFGARLSSISNLGYMVQRTNDRDALIDLIEENHRKSSDLGPEPEPPLFLG